jgi:hypothetical protein
MADGFLCCSSELLRVENMTISFGQLIINPCRLQYSAELINLTTIIHFRFDSYIRDDMHYW